MAEKKILIIDDDTEFSLLVKMNLEMLGGFKVVYAASSSEGIKMARGNKPDLILLDIVMPEVDGFGVLKVLKRDPRTKHIHVVMLTVSDDEVSKLKAAQLYCEGYITKPIGAEELKNAIELILKDSGHKSELLKLQEGAGYD